VTRTTCLSAGPLRGISVFVGVLCLAFAPSVATAAVVRIAVMGDSISAGSGVSGGSPNWVSQLNGTGTVSFQNKAVGGAVSIDVVNNQLPAVKTLAQNHSIDDAVLMIGGNDAVAAGADIINGGTGASYATNYFNNVKTVIDQLQAVNPGLRIVFANMPDITVTPAVKAYANAAQLQTLRGVIIQANTLADQYALSHGVPVVDMYTASQTIGAAIPMTLGGHTFTTAFAPDNFHPAPFLQGLLSNMVVTAMDQKFHQTLPLLTDQKIVTNSHFTAGPGATYYNVAPFVIVPEPSTWTLSVLAGVGVAAFRLRRRVA